MSSILLVHNRPMPFVLLDRDLLAARFSVRESYLRSRRINLYSVYRAVRSVDLVYGWFASWHTFWPLLFARLLKKPSLLVIGGYDVANMPEIGYGHQRGGLKRWVSRAAIRSADVLVTNSRYSQQEIERNLGLDSNRVHLAYHGVPDLFGELSSVDSRSLVLTVGNVEADNLWRKGHEPFVRAAALLPHLSFCLVGAWRDQTIEYLRSLASANLNFTGWIKETELIDIYRRTSVYVQASGHEGFGMSVAESMLAGCIPVVARVGALPEVVGDCGYYVESQDPTLLAKYISVASDSTPEMRRLARERILDLFPLKKRSDILFGLIDGVISTSNDYNK
ncbi:MAG: glycosyltransferase family 4 protein [Anaerolineales bacterium]|nr:glycosyltransferase family 4 protein [Anaerolineales bacterium]